MCGIVGDVGKEQAAPILLDGLSKLEYRGYDSAGMAVYDGEKIVINKSTGRLKVLSELTHDGENMPGHIGIGHTRWATHGEPTETNAHPHFNESKTIAVVHNGIIENYLKLKNLLIERGYQFVSDTDTEVVAHLLDYYYKKYDKDPLTAVVKVIHRVEGSYALGIIFADYPDVVYSVRKDSPLIVGKAKEGKPGYVSLLQDGKHRFNGRAGVQDHQKTLLIRQLFNGERRELLGVISAGEC